MCILFYTDHDSTTGDHSEPSCLVPVSYRIMDPWKMVHFPYRILYNLDPADPYSVIEYGRPI